MPGVRRPMLCVVGFLAVVGALVVWTAPASAHARLVSSTPAGGATVSDPPPLIRLQFNEGIESSFAGVQVFDPSGARVTEQGPPSIRGRIVELPLTPIAASGTYTVLFRVISADGHPVEARFSFLFEPRIAAAISTTSTSVPSVRPEDLELEDAGSTTDVGLWLSRACNYLALALLMGFLVTAVVLVRGSDGDTKTRRRAISAAVAVGVALAITDLLLFAFSLSNAAARGLSDVVTTDLIGRFAETRFGRVVLGQAVLAVMATVLAALARRRPLLARAALVVTGVAAVAPATWGHAGTDDLPLVAVSNDWLHLLAVTAWAGGLAALLLLLGRSEAPVAEAVGRFSRLAGWALAVALATGVVNALLHLGSADGLTGTAWGRLVIVKATLLSAVAGLGYLARKRLLPTLRDGPTGRRGFVQIAALEVTLMVTAFGVATQMANGIPADAEAAARVQSIAVQFGTGELNVTVDPGRTGANVVHMYVFDATGRLDERSHDPSMTLIRAEQRLTPDLVASGPGHWVSLGQRIPTSGEWIVRVDAITASGAVSASGAVMIR